MNRWTGIPSDSARQSADRSSRAARRIIAALPTVTSESEDEFFEDADTSLINVDGQADPGAMSTAAQAAAAELARQRALPFEDQDFENDVDSWKKEVKIKFEAHDVTYWFNTVESQMKKFGINRQWDRKDAIVPLLPDNVVDECKPLLRLTEAEAGESIYKDLKAEIVSLYGPREEDAFKKAIALKMTGKPSAFGKKLIHIVCPGSRPFTTCHCARMVFGFWEAQLSAPIKTVLSGKQFNAATYTDLFKLADEAWLANGGATSTPAVIAAVSETPTPTTTPEVAAVSQRGAGRGRGGRGQSNRARGRGANSASNRNTSRPAPSTQNDSKPHQKGTKHPDLPASASWACAQHWRKGRSAPYCSDPLVCQWVNVVAPRTSTA